jgi:hypothetical protein
MFVPAGASVVGAADVAEGVVLAAELVEELAPVSAPASGSSVPAQPVSKTAVVSSRAAGMRPDRAVRAGMNVLQGSTTVGRGRASVEGLATLLGFLVLAGDQAAIADDRDGHDGDEGRSGPEEADGSNNGEAIHGENGTGSGDPGVDTVYYSH